MPYLQLDTAFPCSSEDRRRLARRFGEIYAAQMQTNAYRVTVAIRVTPDGIWHCGDGEPTPAALLMCDIRRGRSVEQRTALAVSLLAACHEILGLRDDQMNVEFTQHAGDEMYHPTRGGPSDDWTPDEAVPTNL